MYSYQAFGLAISSEIELPQLIPVNTSDDLSVDVTIEYGKIDKNGLKDPTSKDLYCQSTINHLWLHVPEVAWFEVMNGNKIVVMAETGADLQSIRLFLLGSCMGCILHQRHYLVMHANTIRFGNQCVMFAGASGNGKSTLAAAFHQRGQQILADDVSAINKQGDVTPSYPQIKLWHDAIKQLGIGFSGLNKIRLQVEKYAYPLSDTCFCQQPLPLSAIYLLSSHNEDEFLMEPINGFKKFNPIKNNTYRPKYIKGLELQSVHLKQVGQLAKRIRVTRITRPNRSFQIERLIDFILEDMQSHGMAV
ncbi:MAG TPA: hypothetical protein ENJ32_05405 [Crenotrichaceae bacterium]|nr:hypothetical protein [Crenotrichaceae bacterium]